MIANIQKIGLLTAMIFFTVNVRADTDPPKKYIPDEVIVFVTLKINENKSKDEIKAKLDACKLFIQTTESALKSI